jgi:Subtilisin inhibitor-like
MKPLRMVACAGMGRTAARAVAAGSMAGALLLGAGAARTLAAPGPSAGPSGPSAGPSTEPTTPTPPVPPGPGVPDNLLITARESPSSPELAWSLTCNPDGGTHPDPALACQTLSTVQDPFATVPAGVVCSMIYYGPQTATVTGYWQGLPVSAQFSRVNGCEEQRWEKIAPVLVVPVPQVPANPGGPIRPGPPSPASPPPGG